MALERVVVGVDGSESSDRALEWAARLATGAGTEVIVVHAWSKPESEGFGQRVVAEATAHLADHGVPARSVTDLTDPGPLLVDVAEHEDADLIVVGSHGRNLLVQLALGSVGEFLAHHSPRPVAIVRLEGDGPSG